MNVMNDELLDLLAERATCGLSSRDEVRLSELLEDAGLAESDDMELAAAAAMNAFASKAPMSDQIGLPETLEKKLRDDADRFFTQTPKSGSVTAFPSARSARATTRHSVDRSWFARSGWAVAAVLAVFVLVTAIRPEAGSRSIDSTAARQALLEQAETSISAWSESEIPGYAHVTGDVVWNDSQQTGFLRLAGMPANDPSISQYQLWIVDPDRDANPVDGGVFNVPSGTEEIIIPINAKLNVSDPQAFAITREKPGGVVISDGPLLIVAAS